MELKSILKYELNKKLYYTEGAIIHEGFIKGFEYTVDNGTWYLIRELNQETWQKESNLLATKEEAEKAIKSKQKELELEKC